VRSRELVLALLVATGAATAQPADEAPTRAQVEEAVRRARAHPDLAGKRTEMHLRVRPSEQKEQRKADPGSSPLRWLADLVRWANDAARILMWTLGALAVALVLVGVRRWILVRGGLLAPARPTPPSHVQNLDIRPESLPSDIGQAAAQLWQRGERRPALSLLYRGALSRLVHGEGLPIRAAHTEGECVQLAQARLPAPPAAFFARLVGAWQLAVYAGRMPADDEALALFRAFERELPTASEAVQA
jgi:hypothetical protein